MAFYALLGTDQWVLLGVFASSLFNEFNKFVTVKKYTYSFCHQVHTLYLSAICTKSISKNILKQTCHYNHQ